MQARTCARSNLKRPLRLDGAVFVGNDQNRRAGIFARRIFARWLRLSGCLEARLDMGIVAIGHVL